MMEMEDSLYNEYERNTFFRATMQLELGLKDSDSEEVIREKLREAYENNPLADIIKGGKK